MFNILGIMKNIPLTTLEMVLQIIQNYQTSITTTYVDC
jgi:hypothetical protein